MRNRLVVAHGRSSQVRGLGCFFDVQGHVHLIAAHHLPGTPQPRLLFDLTGERPEPAFLSSMPFQPAMLSAVASQALFFQRTSRNRAPKVA